jgi:hypothetical protein
MRDEDHGAGIVSISSRGRSKVSDLLGSLLDELALSESQKRRARARAREMGLAVSELDEAAVRLDRQVSRLLAEGSTSRNDNAFIYLMQQQTDETETVVRRDAFDVHRYDQELKVLRTVLGCALSVLSVGLSFSMWLIATGREEIGNPILSAIVSGALSYLAGVGTPRGLLRRGGPGSERGEEGRL